MDRRKLRRRCLQNPCGWLCVRPQQPCSCGVRGSLDVRFGRAHRLVSPWSGIRDGAVGICAVARQSANHDCRNACRRHCTRVTSDPASRACSRSQALMDAIHGVRRCSHDRYRADRNVIAGRQWIAKLPSWINQHHASAASLIGPQLRPFRTHPLWMVTSAGFVGNIRWSRVEIHVPHTGRASGGRQRARDFAEHVRKRQGR